jgi:hypothetical protein
MSSRYVPLLPLAVAWAAECGELRAVVLRRIVDWSIVDGGFPLGSFVTSAGVNIAHHEIRRWFYIAIEAPSEPQRKPLYFGMHPTEAEHKLGGILVNKSEVISLCDRVGAHPPHFILARVRFFAALRGSRHPPASILPDCSQAADAEAEKESERRLELGRESRERETDRQIEWAISQGIIAPSEIGTISDNDEERIETPSRKTAGAENECRGWLIALMNAGGPTKPKTEYRSEAVSRFGIGTRAFVRAWSTAIQATGAATRGWGQPGRKS